MRVTNALITRDTIARLQERQGQLAEAQERVTTGKRIRTMSDDPTAASVVMQSSASLRALEQYRRNVQSVSSRLSAEELALDQVTQLVSRAKEVGVGQVGATANGDSRDAAAAEVAQLLKQIVHVANQQFGDEYLFGGANAAATAPFDPAQSGTVPRYVPLAAGVPRLPQGMRSVEIGAGRMMQGAHDGDRVFVQTGVLEAVHDMQAALAADDSDGITDAMRELDAAFAEVQTLIGDLGARQNEVDLVTAGYDALEATHAARKGELSEVDMEEAITRMLNHQTAYQAAMLASSKVIGMSLTDYLR